MGDVSTVQEVTSKSVMFNSSVVYPRFDVAALGAAKNAEGIPADNYLDEVIMTQYGIKKGLEIFGEKGTSAVKKEMQQVHDCEVLVPVDASKMNSGEKSEALRYLIFLKEKSDGTIKGRGCADGRKNRIFIDKDSASSPTISTEELFLIVTIAAK